MKPILCWGIGVSVVKGGEIHLTRCGLNDDPPELFRTRREVEDDIREWVDAKKYFARPVRVEIRLVKK